MPCVAALALTGCMKIYPDSELPDVEATWLAEDCRDDSVVELSLIGIDTPTFRLDRVVPCADTKSTFVDVARERYLLDGKLRSAADPELNTYQEEIDLRNGFNKRTEMYFNTFSNVRITWTFAMDATCETLGADTVLIAFSTSTSSDQFEIAESCAARVHFAGLPDGVFTASATALTPDGVAVAVSPPSPEFTVDLTAFPEVDLELVPCDDECP